MKSLAAKTLLVAALLVGGVSGAFPGHAGAQAPAGPPATLIPLSGQFATPEGQPRTGSVVLVISLYEGRDDAAPRWIEHQTVTLDAQGRYDVRFGGTREEGLPADLFTTDSGTRWVGVGIENEAEQPRVMLVSVPYAARAASADSLGGRAASEFVTTTNLTERVREAIEENDDPVSSDAVTLNFIQKGDGTGITTDAANFVEVGGNVGIGTTSPSQRLSVNGNIQLSSNSPTWTGGGNFMFSNTTSSSSYRLSACPSTGDASCPNNGFVVHQNGVATRFAIASNGNIGIGTTVPSQRLSVDRGNIALSSNNSSWAAEGNFMFSNVTSPSRYRVAPCGGTGDASCPAHGFVIHQDGSGTRLAITNTGFVGIGTIAPAQRLHVNGNALVVGDMTVNGNIAAKYQDVAEWVDAVGALEAGTVVMIDITGSNRVMAADGAYSSRVAGAVSPQPGLILGEPGEGRVLVAQSGRVRVKVDASYGAIQAGDLLVTSPRTGYAMRSQGVPFGDTEIHRPGTVLGKALESIQEGTGDILVLLTLQ